MFAVSLVKLQIIAVAITMDSAVSSRLTTADEVVRVLCVKMARYWCTVWWIFNWYLGMRVFRIVCGSKECGRKDTSCSSFNSPSCDINMATATYIVVNTTSHIVHTFITLYKSGLDCFSCGNKFSLSCNPICCNLSSFRGSAFRLSCGLAGSAVLRGLFCCIAVMLCVWWRSWTTQTALLLSSIGNTTIEHKVLWCSG